MPLPDDLSDVVGLQIGTFLGTAGGSLVPIHEADTLHEPLLRQGGRTIRQQPRAGLHDIVKSPNAVI